MACHLIDTGENLASENMQHDAKLLANLKSTKELQLHLYDWKQDALTFGHFIQIESFIDMQVMDRYKLDYAKRPTGGGITFHNCDLAFSLLMPASHPAFSTNTLQNYAFVNERVKKVITQFRGMKEREVHLLDDEKTPVERAHTHFCMAHPTKYDVMIEGKKVGGSAQRRTRDGFLHQGSIFIGSLDPSYLNALLLPGSSVAEAMMQNSYPLIEGGWTKKDLVEARHELRSQLIRVFSEESYV